MVELRKALEMLGLDSEWKTLCAFEKYMEQVLLWNEKVNLTAITERSEFIQKHFIDSLLCADFPEMKKAETIIDVGTGAGFPGVPLALIFPEKRFLLVDSLKKRLKIIWEICEEMGLSNIEVLHGRAEDLGQDPRYRERYDLCVSRAVARLSVLTEYCLPFVRVGGAFFAYKGADLSGELVEAKKAALLLGAGTVLEKKVSLENFDFDHCIVVMEKAGKTPAKYPRKAGIPSKEPLK